MFIRNTGARNRLFALSLIAVMLVAGVAAAQGRDAAACGPRGGAFRNCDGPRADGGMRLERMVRRLDLTEEQVAAIEQLQESGRADNLELRKQMLRLRNEMQGEMLKDEPAEKTVLSLTRKLGDLRTQMQENRARTRLAVRSLLTEDQKDKMLLMKGKSRRAGMRGCGAGDGCHSNRQRGPRHERSRHEGPRRQMRSHCLSSE